MKYPALRDRLRWLGMTQQELAEKLSMKEKRLNNMLEGYNYMPVEVALRISKVLGKSVEELFRYVEIEEE